jgi:hypothetical protein
MGDFMTGPATKWGDMAEERDILINAIVSMMEWRKALEVYNNTPYKGDAIKVVDLKRAEMETNLVKAQGIIDYYRR